MEQHQLLGDKGQDGKGINEGFVREHLCLCRKLLAASEAQRLPLCK